MGGGAVQDVLSSVFIAHNLQLLLVGCTQCLRKMMCKNMKPKEKKS